MKETLEERKPYWDLVDKKAEENNSIDLDVYAKGVQDGAKYMQDKMFSEEDMLNFAWFLIENVGQYSCDRTAHFEGKYLEQFKNK